MSRSSVPHWFAAAYNAQNVDALLDCFTPDASYRDLYFGLKKGHPQLRTMFRAAFRRGRHTWTMTEVVGDGGLTMCEWTFTMITPGSDGSLRRLRFNGASVFELTDGRCHSYREFFDRGSTLLAIQNSSERVARLVARHPSVEMLTISPDDTGHERAEPIAT